MSTNLAHKQTKVILGTTADRHLVDGLKMCMNDENFSTSQLLLSALAASGWQLTDMTLFPYDRTSLVLNNETHSVMRTSRVSPALTVCHDRYFEALCRSCANYSRY